MTMDCRQVEIYLQENFLAEGYKLPGEMIRHLDQCASCRALYDDMLLMAEKLAPLSVISMTPDETTKFEAGLLKEMESVDSYKSGYAPEIRMFSIARLALAAAAVLVMMITSYNPDFPVTPALVEGVDQWKPTGIETEDVAIMFANGESDLLTPVLDDESVSYLTRGLQPGQAEDILESVTHEELNWLLENITMEI